MDSLVSTDWLETALRASDLRILDATYVDKTLGRDVRAEFTASHIPGAVFLDLTRVADTASPLPTMLPDAAAFADALSALGIGNNDRIVLYDDSPWRTAARAWFMFRSFGITDVAILDGGLGKWRAEGRPLTAEPTPSRKSSLTAPTSGIGVRDKTQMLANLDTTAEQVVDARSAARFSGAEADPRPGVAPGHIPGSANLPYTKLFAPDGTYRDTAALAAAFAEAGIDPARPTVATCGSGVTASTIAFAAHLLGYDQVAVYDGSWSEWGADPATPKAMS